MIGFAERRGLSPALVPDHPAHRLPWRALHNPYGLLVLVLPWIAFMAIVGWTMRGQISALAFQDPDDAMRLLELRAWLAGQSWWDVSNYRAGGPGGFSMHWSRLVDVPIAALVLLFDLFLPAAEAERAAISVLPPLQLLIALVLLRSTLRCLGFRDATANIVLLVIPLLTLVMGNMVPMKIDHHAWQALCAGAMLRLMVDRRNQSRQAFLAGAVGGLLVTISIEGLPLVAAACGVYAAFHVQSGRDRGLAHFLAGLTVASALLFVATRHWQHWGREYADAISWPHLAGFALASGCAFAFSHRRKIPLPMVAVGSVLLVAAAGALPVLAVFGIEGLAPFGRMDPLVRQYWLDGVQEVRPFYRLLPDIGAMLGWMVVLYLMAVATQARKRLSGQNARGWFVAFALSGAMLALSLVIFRAALLAQILMVPLLAAMVHDTLRLISRFESAVLRIVGTVTAVLLLSPTAGSLAGKSLMARAAMQTSGTSAVAAGDCDFARLTALPQGRILSSVDVGPAILLKSPHAIVAAGYHRNQAALHDAIASFISPLTEARGAVSATQADYLVLCRNTPDVAGYAQSSESSLASALLDDRAPDWLVPVPGFEDGALRAWRIR